MEENVPVQAPQAPPEKKKNFSALTIVFVVISVVLLGASSYLFIERGKDKNTISELQATVTEKENEVTALKEEGEMYKDEIDNLQQQIEEYIERINELENPPYFTNYFPVQYRFGQFQKLGQSFKVEKSTTLTKLILTASFGVGDDIVVNIYNTDEDGKPITTTTLGSSKFKATDIVKGEEFEVVFDTPVVLSSGKTYFFELSAGDTKTQTAIAFAEENVYEEGKMWVFTRLIGGNGEILDSNHSWQSRNSHDVIFRLEEESLTKG